MVRLMRNNLEKREIEYLNSIRTQIANSQNEQAKLYTTAIKTLGLEDCKSLRDYMWAIITTHPIVFEPNLVNVKPHEKSIEPCIDYGGAD